MASGHWLSKEKLCLTHSLKMMAVLLTGLSSFFLRNWALTIESNSLIVPCHHSYNTARHFLWLINSKVEMVVTCCKKKTHKSHMQVVYSRTDHCYSIPFLTLKLYTTTTQQVCQNLKATKCFGHNRHRRDVGRQLQKQTNQFLLNSASPVHRSSLPHLYSLSSDSAFSKQLSSGSVPCVGPALFPGHSPPVSVTEGCTSSAKDPSWLWLVLWIAKIFCLLFPSPTTEIVSIHTADSSSSNTAAQLQWLLKVLSFILLSVPTRRNCLYCNA